MKMKKVVIVAAIFLIVAFLAANRFVLDGAAIVDIPKPQITYDANGVPITTEPHINYLLNYIGGTELKKIIFTENYPQIEILTSIKKTYYTSYVVDGEIQTYPGRATDPDLQIRIGEDTIAEVIKASDPQAAIKTAKDQGKIGVTINSGYTELFLKGYLKIYDNLK